MHDLSNAVADAARAYEACENALNRLNAANSVLIAYETQVKNDLDVDIDRQLDAQRRVVEAEIRYYQARAEYAVALKNVHLEKGSLMGYTELQILDGVVPVIKEEAKPSNSTPSSSEETSDDARSIDPAVDTTESSDPFSSENGPRDSAN